MAIIPSCHNAHWPHRLFHLLALLVLLLSCQPWYEREPLEVYYDGVAQVKFEIDWLNHMEEKPSGMTLLLAKDGDTFTTTRVSNNVDYVTMRLPAGNYKVMVISYAFDEYASMTFSDQESYNAVAARSNDLTTRINESWDRGVVYMMTPEVVGVATDTFTISEADIEAQRHFIDYREREKPDTLYILKRETVYEMTCLLNIFVQVSGLKFMRSVTGSISGMADGFYLSHTLRTTEHGPLLLDDWFRRIGSLKEVMAEFRRTRSPSCLVTRGDTLSVSEVADDDEVHEWICMRVPTFGFPHGRETEADRVPRSNILTLCFTMLDGSTRTYSYEVGKHIHYRQDGYSDITGNRPTDGGLTASVQLDLDLVIDNSLGYPDLPYVDDPGSSSGTASAFDVIVDPWEEGDTIDIGLSRKQKSIF